MFGSFAAIGRGRRYHEYIGSLFHEGSCKV